MDDLTDYEWLTSAEAADVLVEFAGRDDSVFRQMEQLRKVLRPERARLIVEQLALRKKAIHKFGTLAERMLFTEVGLQQATDLWIARYKAARIGKREEMVDYCCGIGGDLLAMAKQGRAIGWDRDEKVAFIARANLQLISQDTKSEVCVGDVEQQVPGNNAVWHLDPDRRVDGRRSTQMQWHSPGLNVIDQWREVNPNGVLKLAPAAQVSEEWQEQAELEWISRERECRQLVVWFGGLALNGGKRRATVLKKSSQDGERWEPHSFVGDVNEVAELSDRAGLFVYDTDPAIRAAGLTGAIANELGLTAMAGGPSYLTSEERIDHPLVSCFEVIEQMPFRIKALAKRLSSLGMGQLEIKKRGVEISPEKLRKQLKLKGSETGTLLIGKVGASEMALIARRCE